MNLLPCAVSTAILAVAACAAPTNAEPSAARPAPVASHLLVSDWVNGDDGMLALTYGVLVVQRDGCVGLRVPGARKPALLSWPAGSTLSDDGTSVRGSSGRQLRRGDEVSFGGGYGLRDLPAECDASSWSGVFEIQQPL